VGLLSTSATTTWAHVDYVFVQPSRWAWVGELPVLKRTVDMLQEIGVSAIRQGGSFTDPSYYFWKRESTLLPHSTYCLPLGNDITDIIRIDCRSEQVGAGTRGCAQAFQPPGAAATKRAGAHSKCWICVKLRTLLPSSLPRLSRPHLAQAGCRHAATPRIWLTFSSTAGGTFRPNGARSESRPIAIPRLSSCSLWSSETVTIRAITYAASWLLCPSLPLLLCLCAPRCPAPPAQHRLTRSLLRRAIQ
jgi:hypothetical protein